MIICFLNSRILRYEKFTIKPLSMWGGTRWVRYKKSKFITVPSRSAGLKSRLIPTHHFCKERKTSVGWSRKELVKRNGMFHFLQKVHTCCPLWPFNAADTASWEHAEACSPHEVLFFCLGTVCCKWASK